MSIQSSHGVEYNAHGQSLQPFPSKLSAEIRGMSEDKSIHQGVFGCLSRQRNLIFADEVKINPTGIELVVLSSMSAFGKYYQWSRTLIWK